MSDLLRPLLDAIHTVRQRIESAKFESGWNEAQTRASLIDPVLTALGWDTADPSLVRHEHKGFAGTADYALMGPHGKLAAIVEAKALGNGLEVKEISQTNYANIRGAPFAVLTNGERWTLYDVFTRAAIEERKLIDVSVSRDEPQAAALGLLALWRPNASSGQCKKAEAPRIIGAHPPPPPRPPAPDPGDWKALPAVSPSSGQPRPPAPDPGDWKALPAVPPSPGHPRPTAIRFPDLSEQPISTWKQLLIRSAEWLAKTGALDHSKVPLDASKTRFLINRTAVHVTGKKFHAPHQVAGTGLFLETHWSARNTLHHTVRLFKHCGRNPAGVELQTRATSPTK